MFYKTKAHALSDRIFPEASAEKPVLCKVKYFYRYGNLIFTVFRFYMMYISPFRMNLVILQLFSMNGNTS